MNSSLDTPGFAKAMLEFFGKTPGETISGFMNEVKALDDADREFFCAELRRLGLLTEGATATTEG